MIGPAKPRRLEEPITVSLEGLVPANHFYHHLETKLDLSFVREWVTEHYAERGRPSIDHLGPGPHVAPGGCTVRIETGGGHRGP